MAFEFTDLAKRNIRDCLFLADSTNFAFEIASCFTSMTEGAVELNQIVFD